MLITRKHLLLQNTNFCRAVHGYVDMNVKLAKGAANMAVQGANSAANIAAQGANMAVHGGEKAYEVVAPYVGLSTSTSNEKKSNGKKGNK